MPSPKKKNVHFASPVVTKVFIIPPREEIKPHTLPNYSFMSLLLSHPATKIVTGVFMLAAIAALSAVTLGVLPLMLGLSAASVSFACAAGLFSASRYSARKLENDPSFSNTQSTIHRNPHDPPLWLLSR